MRIRALLMAVSLTVIASQAPAAGPAKTDSETRYLAMLINGEKVGYAKHVRSVADGKVTTEQTSKFTLNRMGATIPVSQSNTWIETRDGTLVEMESVSMMGTFKGVMNEAGDLEVTMKSQMGNGRKQTADLPKGVLFAEGMRQEQKRRGYKEGTTYSVKTYAPELGSVVTMNVTIGKKEKLDLLGRVVEGVKVTTDTDLGMMQVTEVSYLDDEGELLRMDTDVLGMKITALACDEAFALSPVKTPTDFVGASLLKSPKPVPLKAEKVVYTLKAKSGKEITVPTLDTQQVEKRDDGSLRVTVSRLVPPKGMAFPYTGKDKTALEAMGANIFVQSEDEKIIAAAKGAVGQTKDATEAARRIADWVSKHVTKKNLSVGYASASEVLRSREGDCTEHGVLTAALCRAVGIPARVAVGAIYAPEWQGHKQIFGGHQWTQVFIGDKWYDLDATVPPEFRDARRITLTTNSGEARELIKLLASMGKFEITDVTVPK